jgi:hypothetical protein
MCGFAHQIRLDRCPLRLIGDLVIGYGETEGHKNSCAISKPKRILSAAVDYGVPHREPVENKGLGRKR